MEGGKYLGSGTYGCIFYPAVMCSNGKKLEGVGKIFSDKTERDGEFELGKRIQHVDPNGAAMNILTDECDVTRTEIMKNEQSNQCKHITHSTQIYNQLIYKEKGVDLDKFFKNNRGKYCLFDKNVEKYITNLLKGVELLQDHNLAHMDIKPENILVSDKNKLLLIDFGLTRELRDIYDIEKSDYLLKYSYHIYPPEFKVFMILNRIKRAKLDMKSDSYYDKLHRLIMKVYTNKYQGFTGYDHVLYKLSTIQVSKHTLKQEFSEFVTQLLDQMKEQNMTHKSCPCALFRRVFAKKADVFSVGLVLLYFYYHSKPSECNDSVHKYVRFVDLIKKTWCMNPYERYTIKDVIKEYTNILAGDNQEKNKEFIIESPLRNKAIMDKCMKHKKRELQDMVVKNKLAKSVKYLNKKSICERLVPYLTEEDTHTKYVTAKQNNVSMNDCKRYYSLNELKAIVDQNNLPKKYKMLNKEQICDKILPYLLMDTDRKTIKRGPKIK